MQRPIQEADGSFCVEKEKKNIYAMKRVCAHFEPKVSKMCSTIRFRGINIPWQLSQHREMRDASHG